MVQYAQDQPSKFSLLVSLACLPDKMCEQKSHCIGITANAYENEGPHQVLIAAMKRYS